MTTVLTSHNRPLRLAYVEDQSADYHGLMESWREHHFTNPIDWYRTGEDFLLAMLAPDPPVPELALIDLGLPGLSGQETMQQIRANQAIAHVPLFIVTARDLETAQSVQRLVGAAHACSKPLRTPNLLEMLFDINRKTPKFGLELVRLPDDWTPIASIVPSPA